MLNTFHEKDNTLMKFYVDLWIHEITFLILHLILDIKVKFYASKNYSLPRSVDILFNTAMIKPTKEWT